MQALHHVEPGRLEWRAISAPALKDPTDAIVRPIAVAACDLDRAIASGASPFPGPFIMGHEFCGEVIEVGDAVRSLAPGDIVIASFQPSCGTCPCCQRGHSSVCRNTPTTSMYGIGAAGGDWGGALTDLVRIPWAEFNLREIPDGIDPIAIASGSDNLADGLRAVDEPLRENPGASVLIAGSGSIPLYAAQLAGFLGAGQVTFASDDRFALESAEALGADCIEVTQWPRRFSSHDITFDCTNHNEGLAAVVRSTAPHGVMTIASIYFAPLTPIPLVDMYMKGITLRTGRVNSAAQLDRVLELAAQGLDPDAIRPAKLPMAHAIDAFASVPPSRKLILQS
ncbi:MAG: alcohol dehydrogenase catalytic domain-containing protein [Pseudomonadales bacterium]|jgi:alcohol dehydrogenase